MQANSQEADADVKEGGFIQVLAKWKMRDSHLKAQLNVSDVLDNLHRGTIGRGELRNFW